MNFPKKTNNPNPSPIGNKFGLFLFGPSGENRTHGLLNPIQARYQNCATPGYLLELIAHSSISIPDFGRFVKRFLQKIDNFFEKEGKLRCCVVDLVQKSKRSSSSGAGSRAENSGAVCPSDGGEVLGAAGAGSTVAKAMA